MTQNVRYRLPQVTYPQPEDAALWRDSGAWANTTVGHAMRHVADQWPDRVAVVDGNERLTFAEVDEQSDALAAALRERGVVPPAPILMQMGTSLGTVIALATCFKVGLIPVCAVPRYGAREMLALAKDTLPHAHFVEPRAAPSGSDLTDLARSLQLDVSTLRTTVISGASADDEATLSQEGLVERARGAATRDELRRMAQDLEPGPEDVLAFQLSGGTTAVPKIIPRFHAEYLGYAQHWSRRVGIESGDIVLWALPLSHNAGMILALVPCLTQGATLVLNRRFDIATFLASIERERVTLTGSIGPIAGRLLEFEQRANYDLSSLRLFVTLSSAAEIEAETGVPACNIYGITEGLLLASGPDSAAAARHGTVGKPVSPDDEVKVVALDESGEAAAGAVGELCFRGPSMLTAYVARPAETQAAFTADGFFRTGDLCRAEGHAGRTFYAFSGRLKDNIDRGGEKFGVEDIESLLSEHPSILEAHVVAMPDKQLGERACAFVIVRPGADVPSVDEVGSFLLERQVAKFKLPERMETIEAFPVTSVGKLDRAALRALIAKTLELEAQHPMSGVS